MSLSAAFNIMTSSFASTAAQSAIISKNIANAGIPGYSRETANLGSTFSGGSAVDSITREVASALFAQVSNSTSQAARQQALSDGIATLAHTVNDSASAASATGATQNGGSPSALLSQLQNALQTYAASPNSPSLGQATLTAAASLARSLNSASNIAQQVRTQADSSIANSVVSINSILAQFSKANTAIVGGLASDGDVTSAQDKRDSLLTQLATQVGISTVSNTDGSMSIYTDSGVPLFQDTPRAVTFTPSPTLGDGAPGNAVMVDGTPITGSQQPMAVRSGAIAGLAALRDSIAPQYQAQLDQIAGGLVNSFAETDQSSAPALPALPGLFTAPGLNGVPSITQMTGLAASIEINPNVDPAQGGNASLLRDGGISDPTNPSYNYNTASAAGFSGRLQQLTAGLSAPGSFAAGAGLPTSTSLTDYASNSVGSLQGQNQQASNEASYQSALAAQATSALSSATGVNMDTEMTNMLNLENSYSTTAKLLTTANAMFSALLNAA